MGHFPQDGKNEHLMMMMTIYFNEATRLLERSRSRWQEEEQRNIQTFRQILLILPVLGKMTHICLNCTFCFIPGFKFNKSLIGWLLGWVTSRCCCHQFFVIMAPLVLYQICCVSKFWGFNLYHKFLWPTNCNYYLKMQFVVPHGPRYFFAHVISLSQLHQH